MATLSPQRSLLIELARGIGYTDPENPVCVVCPYCLSGATLAIGYRGIPHSDDCLVTRARAAVNFTPEEFG